MGKIKNILFVMADQLRWDYLSCAGHPTLETPNIDRLASKGVQFTLAHTVAPVCGPARMSFYTGRYAFSHGATWNNVPLDVSELTLGDYLRPAGIRVALVGKTHHVPDRIGMARLGFDLDNDPHFIGQGGFEPYERDDGLHPGEKLDITKGYSKYLIDHGYVSDNPWHDFANSAVGEDGRILSGWRMRWAREPARVAAEHSETAYTTTRAIDFIDEAGDDPWCLHLSYIKPHWPYVAPAPYHALYSANQVIPANRHPDELTDPHPVVAAFMKHEEGQSFSRDEVRETVIPTYMGLIKQFDDELGRLFDHLEKAGRMDDTLIVVTSDHGDYLGDHWLGEKELFHEESVRIPMIVYDPDPAANATRGTVDRHFVEAIDLVPTFIEAVGAECPTGRLEGRSLMALIRENDPGKTKPWRDHAISEIEWSFRDARRELGTDPREARAVMVRTEKWKYIYYYGFRPQLFDLEADPKELDDLGADSGYKAVCDELNGLILGSFTTRGFRRTLSDTRASQLSGSAKARGFRYGEW